MQIQLDLRKTPFNLDHTLSCGQTFRWEKRCNSWIGVVGQTALKIRHVNSTLDFEVSSDRVNTGFIKRYFRLDDDLPSIYSEIAKDKHVRRAVRQFHGLRLVRQDPWECLVSYICATFKNIPAIKQMIRNLSTHFGRPVAFDGQEFHAFPEAQALAGASLRDLKACKLGYRAVNVRETANLVSSGKFDLESLRTMSYQEAKKMLLSLPGVGSKVADCVLLFSLDKLEAFPIDIWMKRVILECYSQCFESGFLERIRYGKSLSIRDYQILYDFGRSYFGEYLGYAQEYLYHYKRCQAQLG
jgi:N-glycosylase/DNA lyase